MRPSQADTKIVHPKWERGFERISMVTSASPRELYATRPLPRYYRSRRRGWCKLYGWGRFASGLVHNPLGELVRITRTFALADGHFFRRWLVFSFFAIIGKWTTAFPGNSAVKLSAYGKICLSRSTAFLLRSAACFMRSFAQAGCLSETVHIQTDPLLFGT